MIVLIFAVFRAYFFVKQLQKLLAYSSPAPASADEESASRFDRV